METIKQFADRVAQKLVVYYKFTPDRAILAVRECSKIVKEAYDDNAETNEPYRNADPAKDAADQVALRIGTATAGQNVEDAYHEVRGILEQRGFDPSAVHAVVERHSHLIAKLGAKHVRGMKIVEAIEGAVGGSLRPRTESCCPSSFSSLGGTLKEELSISLRESSVSSLSPSEESLSVSEDLSTSGRSLSTSRRSLSTSRRSLPTSSLSSASKPTSKKR